MTPISDPQNREAEESLLGAVFINPAVYIDIAAFLHTGDFYIHRNGWIWEAMETCSKNGTPIDALTISEELDKQGRLAEAGGGAYLAALMNNVPTSMHAEAYGHIVEEEAIRRRMLIVASGIAQLAHDPTIPVLDAVQQATSSFDIIAPSRIQEAKISDQISDLWEEVETRMADPRDVWGFPTGLIDIDTFLGGLQPGELTVVSGEPGIGKSTLCDQAALNIAKCGFHVAVYSWEMPAKQILRRWINLESGLRAHAMKSGRITNEQFATEFIPSAKYFSQLPISILDDASMSMQQLGYDMLARRRRNQLDVAIIDYIGQIVDVETDRNEREMRQTTELKRWARKLGIHVLAIHTMPKEGVKEKVPGTAHLSGPIQNVNNADNLIFLVEHIPDKKGDLPNPQLITALFAKSREEGKKKINLVRKLDRPGFGDCVRPIASRPQPKSRAALSEPREPEEQQIPF